MEFFHLLIIFSYLSVALVASHAAALSPADYWKLVLPNTLMPNAITELLQPEFFEDQSPSSVGVGKGGVNVDAALDVGRKGGGVGVITTGEQRGKGTKVKPYRVGVEDPPIREPPVKPPVPKSRYAGTADQLKQSHPNEVTLFFLEKDLKKGTQMNLDFTKSKTASDSAATTFLPRHVSEKIPFSSNNLPVILNLFSVEPESAEAETIERTLQECEEPSIRGEERYCATSLESMVDFTTSKLGKNVHAVSTELFQNNNATTTSDDHHQPQKYTIQGVKKIGNDYKGVVVCHKQRYVYGVFYCHKTQQTTRTYLVALSGADGTKVKAVAVCHTDTSAWNPKHLAFQVLKVKPGTVPICHFLPEDHVAWVPY